MEYTARRQQCPIQAPKGLHLVTSEGTLTATLGSNVTFLVFLEEVGEFLSLSFFFFVSTLRQGEGWLCVRACVRVCAFVRARAPEHSPLVQSGQGESLTLNSLIFPLFFFFGKVCNLCKPLPCAVAV